jgi:hypothetical protein
LDEAEHHLDAEEQPQQPRGTVGQRVRLPRREQCARDAVEQSVHGQRPDDAQDGPDDHDRAHQIRVQDLHGVEFGQGAQPECVARRRQRIVYQRVRPRRREARGDDEVVPGARAYDAKIGGTFGGDGPDHDEAPTGSRDGDASR